jgi:hypothetical protein
VLAGQAGADLRLARLERHQRLPEEVRAHLQPPTVAVARTLWQRQEPQSVLSTAVEQAVVTPTLWQTASVAAHSLADAEVESEVARTSRLTSSTLRQADRQLLRVVAVARLEHPARFLQRERLGLTAECTEEVKVEAEVAQPSQPTPTVEPVATEASRQAEAEAVEQDATQAQAVLAVQAALVQFTFFRGSLR